MRACFLGQNICALGYGVAMVQTPPLDEPPPLESASPAPDPRTQPDRIENPMLKELKRHWVFMS